MTVPFGAQNLFKLEDLRNLESSRVLVNVEQRIAVLHVGSNVWHPLRALVDRFFLVFALDDGVVDDVQSRSSDPTVVENALKLCARETAILPNKQMTYTQFEHSSPFKQPNTCHTVCQARLLPLQGTNSARKVLSQCRSHSILPVVVLFQDDTSRCYLGQFFNNKSVSGDVGLETQRGNLESYSVLSVDQLKFEQVSGWTSRDEILTNCLPSLHQKSQPDAAPRLYFEAKYELLGNSATDDNTTAAAYLLTKWEGNGMSVSRLLAEPPLKPESCTMFVNGSLEATEFNDLGNMSLETGSHKLPDASLQVLANLLILSGQASGKANWNCSGQAEFNISHASDTPTSKQWIDFVASFIDSITHKNPTVDGKVVSGGATKVLGFTSCKRSMDFTEQLWGVLEQAPNFADMLLALNRVLSSISKGILIPFIHKDNQTEIGKHIRQAVHLSRALQFGYSASQTTIQENDKCGPASLDEWANDTQTKFVDAASWHTSADSARKSTCDMLFQLGAWKLERDLEVWLGEWNQPHVNTGTNCKSSQSSFGTLPCSTNNETLSKLVALRDVTQLVWIAQHLFAPGDELQVLTRDALTYQRQVLESQLDISGQDPLRSTRSFPVFSVTIKSSLPWLKLAATGTYTLPAPTSWVVKHAQRDHMEAALFSPVGIGTSKFLEPGVALKPSIARSVGRLAVELVESAEQLDGMSQDLVEHMHTEIHSSPVPIPELPVLAATSRKLGNPEDNGGGTSHYAEEVPYVGFVASITTVATA